MINQIKTFKNSSHRSQKLFLNNHCTSNCQIIRYWRRRLTTMSEPLLEASLTAEGLLSTTRPPGTGVEVGGVGVGVAAEAVLAGWLDLGVGAGVTTDDVDTDWSLSELAWFVVPPTTPPMMDTPAPAAAVELDAPDNSSVGKELPTSSRWITKRRRRRRSMNLIF